MTAPIEVMAIRRLDGKTAVKAFVDIRVGAIEIKGCKIIEQPDKPAWLAMPSVKTDRAWNNVIEITSKELRERMTEAAVHAWQSWASRGDLPVRKRSTWDATS